jgi:hypothetical protein
MSYNLEAEKEFALVIAGVKEISSVVEEAMGKEFFHIALEFLEEEKTALNKAISVLKKIKDKKYLETFTEALPRKIKDIEYAEKFCNNLLIEGKFKLASQQEEYKLKKKRADLKIKHYKTLKNISMSTEQWDFADFIDTIIQREEVAKYQA